MVLAGSWSCMTRTAWKDEDLPPALQRLLGQGDPKELQAAVAAVSGVRLFGARN